MEFVKYAIGAAVVLFVLSKLYEGYKEGRAGASDLRHCMTCGVEAKPKTVTKGSLGGGKSAPSAPAGQPQRVISDNTTRD